MRLGLGAGERGFAAARGWGPDDDDDERVALITSSGGDSVGGERGPERGLPRSRRRPQAKSLAAGRGSSRLRPRPWGRARTRAREHRVDHRAGGAALSAVRQATTTRRFGDPTGRGGRRRRGRRDARAAGFCAGTDAQPFPPPERVGVARRGSRRRAAGMSGAPSSGARARGAAPGSNEFQNTVGEAEEETARRNDDARGRAHQTVDASRRTVPPRAGVSHHRLLCSLTRTIPRPRRQTRRAHVRDGVGVRRPRTRRRRRAGLVPIRGAGASPRADAPSSRRAIGPTLPRRVITPLIVRDPALFGRSRPPPPRGGLRSRSRLALRRPPPPPPPLGASSQMASLKSEDKFLAEPDMQARTSARRARADAGEVSTAAPDVFDDASFSGDLLGCFAPAVH